MRNYNARQRIEHNIMFMAYAKFYNRLGKYVSSQTDRNIVWRNSVEFRNARLEVRDTLNGRPA